MSFPHPTDKQGKIIWTALSVLAVALIVAILGLVGWGFVWLLQKLSSVLMPMALAVIMAYVLEPVVQFFERRKIPRLRAVSLVFTLATACLLLSGSLILPGLLRESRNLVADLPRNISVLRGRLQRYTEHSTWLQTITEKLTPTDTSGADTSANTVSPGTNHGEPEEPALQPAPGIGIAPGNTIANHSFQANEGENGMVSTNTNVSAGYGKKIPRANSANPLLDSMQDYLVIIVRWLGAQLGRVTTWAEFLVGFILVPVYLFYFLLEKDSIVRGWQSCIPIKHKATRREVIFLLQSINDCMLVFFRGQVLVALCVGILLAIGYTAMGLRYSVLLGLVAGLLGIVPYLGTITSLMLALLVEATQFGDWTHAFMVLIIAAVVKLLEDLLISPKIVGERSGLHPLVTIVAVLVGTTLLGGFLGALLAIPLTATLRAVMTRYFWNKDLPEAGEK